MIATLPELPLVSQDQRNAILSSPRTAAGHRALMQAIPAMNAVQCGGTASAAVLPDTLSVAAWNVERCLFPQASADLLRPYAPDIVLLSEMDCGMARTGQRHTAADMAMALGMAYAFGVEFHELDLGGPTERQFCTDNFNACGWHGNAILSRVPFTKVTLVRLDDHGHWFASDERDADPNQPRVGGRMALLAVVETSVGPICIASTHLESNADDVHRAAQFDLLMDAIDAFAPNVPVIIGGDLNTGNHMPPNFDWQPEPLFDRARAQGYHWSATPKGLTTRPSLITPHPDRQMKLDWIALRGAVPMSSALIPAQDPAGRPLSDHDAVWCRAKIDG
ncbi:endonuclease/exonuclease/phosphatase family protein [Loktanella salsilacus]|uniref:endonuclease/exonuclease/phosphatase family protein n=1 Tax=Loktanella salsilacus TaxID=195913 RepID=UPI00373605C6